MESFTFSDLTQKASIVLNAASSGPIELTKYGKRKLVLMDWKLFDILTGRKAYTLENAPDEIHAELVAGLDEIIARK